jgi:hypothetical protein
MMRISRNICVTISVVFFVNVGSYAQLGLWTSVEELADKPMSGPAWQRVKNDADKAKSEDANVSDQNSNNNVEILAAGIVYARTGIQSYKDKVLFAIEKLILEGQPPKPSGDVLAWSRETGAYALAADLVDYRTVEFEIWLRNMVEVWGGAGNETMLAMFKRRPNNHGTQAFGSLVAVYAYLQDSLRLKEIRDYWIQGVTGPNPGYTYGGPDNDFSWHVDQGNYRLINPKGAIKEGLDIDGLMPDDIRRNGSFSNPPPPPATPYHWEGLQGIIMAAYIFERIGIPIWDVGDSAIYRSFHILEVRWENMFGGWAAEGDDEWMLPFVDAAYNTQFSKDQSRLWDHGKNAGWGYVVWNPDKTNINEFSIPQSFNLTQNIPNPFNSTTHIHYMLSTYGFVKIDIFNSIGRKVINLVNEYKNPGSYTSNACQIDSNGHHLNRYHFLDDDHSNLMLAR